MSTAPNTYILPEEYLEQERRAEWKSEFLNGTVVAMSGVSRRHLLLERNIIVAFDRLLQGKHCQTYFSNMRVRVSPTGLYTYPDIIVTCGEEQFLDAETDTLLNPVLILEVLSKSTSSYDRGEKFGHYRSIPSFREYLTVAQDSIQVEHYSKQETGQWLLTVYSQSDATIPLTLLGIQLPTADIYRGISI